MVDVRDIVERHKAFTGSAVAERLCLDNPPYELEHAFQAAIEAGETVTAVEIGKTRDLTYPLDLVEENFPYLRSI